MIIYILSVDCEWGEWELGDCSKSCGGGVRLNYREKTVEEMFGGTCEGYPTFEEHCNPQNCPGIFYNSQFEFNKNQFNISLISDVGKYRS